jgi:[ribosomal protein S5]-alanine N-acetyltransferase
MPLDRPATPLSIRLETSHLLLRPPQPGDVPGVRRLLRRNAEHLRPWSPVPRTGEDPSSLTEISKSILRQRREWSKGEAFVFFIVPRADGTSAALPRRGQDRYAGPLLGRIAFTSVVRGAFMSAHLGYWIDRDHLGQGYATEAVGDAVSFAFGALGLHRVQAAVMPHNAASLRVLAKLGFRKEGECVRYLQIAGRWEDHHLFATTREEWPITQPRARTDSSVPGQLGARSGQRAR